jgi:hypothetical protein
MPVTHEAPITFGHVKIQIYINIYNTRITYPTALILLGMADIKACFCFGRIHADLTGAFGFIADNLYNLATPMVIGSTTSASSWEAFRRAIEALIKVFANRLDLVVKHKKILNMLKWDETDPHVTNTRAYPCTTNQGIINENRICLDLPARMYIGGALMLTIDKAHMMMVLVAAIKAIFVVMGEPEIRDCG